MEQNSIKALELYARDIKKLMDKAIERRDKENEKKIKEVESLLAEYPTTNDVYDAYGYGAITEKKKEKLMELHENKEKYLNYETALGKYCEILIREYKNTLTELRMEGVILTFDYLNK